MGWWVLVLFVPAWAGAQTGHSEGDSAATTTARAPVAFEVQLHAPAAVRATLWRHMALQQFRHLPDLTATELRRLVAQAPDQLRSLLGALGHFAPNFTVTLDDTGPLPQVHITVEPGPQAQVGQVQLQLTGHTLTQAEAAVLQTRLDAAWTLPTGHPFTQAAWDAAKSAALSALTRDTHPGATTAHSQADVDPETHTVDVRVEIHPGPVFRFGPTHVEGLQRYEAEWVARHVRHAGVQEGQAYQLAALQAAQQRLAQTGYFESVFVYVDPDATLAEQGHPSPVVVQVREARTGKLVLGAGVSSDSGVRLSAEHTWQRIPGWDWKAVSKARLEGEAWRLSTELSAPLSTHGWRWMAGADTQRQTDATTHTNSQQWRWGQAQDSERLDRRWVVQYDRARTVPVGAAASTSTPTPTASSAVGLYHSWAWRGYDPLPLPERGAGLHAEVGGGWTLQPRRAPFVRTHLRWKQVWPWGRASALPASRWVVRLEGGALLAASSTPVPDSQQFLTGGDHSVRGYGLRSLGVRRPDGSVTAGRWLAVGSVEWQQPWASGPQGERSPWETVLFVDGGGVADRAAQLRPHWGIGGGLRYLTPAGPLQVDLAYGLDRKRWRLHFAVGFAF